MHFLLKESAGRCDFKDPADRSDLDYGFVHVVMPCSMTYSISTILIFCGSVTSEQNLLFVGFALVQDSALPARNSSVVKTTRMMPTMMMSNLLLSQSSGVVRYGASSKLSLSSPLAGTSRGSFHESVMKQTCVVTSHLACMC